MSKELDFDGASPKKNGRETKAQLEERLWKEYNGRLEEVRLHAFQDGKATAENRAKKEIEQLRESHKLKILDGVARALQANAQAQESLARLIDNLGGVRL